MIDTPRRVPGQDDDDDECLARFPGPDASGIEVAGLEDGRLIELERHLPAMRAAKTERVRRLAQLTDELVQNSALLEQTEVEAKVD